MPVGLVKLKRHQRTRDNYSEPLSPALPQPQTGAFAEEQPGINEASQSKFRHLFRTHIGRLLQSQNDKMSSRVEPQYLNPVREHVPHIFVQKVKEPDPQRD